jgi:hypothetical protein
MLPKDIKQEARPMRTFKDYLDEYHGQLQKNLTEMELALMSATWDAALKTVQPTTNGNAAALSSIANDLIYIESVMAKFGVVQGSKCHEMLCRCVERLNALQK